MKQKHKKPSLFFLVLLTLFKFSASYAQFDADFNYQRLLLEYTKAETDSARLSKLYDLAKFARDNTGDFVLADTICQKAIDLALQSGSRNLLLQAYNTYFECNDLTLHFKKTLEYSSLAEKLCNNSNDSAMIWRTFFNISEVYFAGYDYDKALTYGTHALVKAEINKNDLEKAKSYLSIGKCLEARNQKIAAFKNYLSAFNLAEKISSRELLSACYSQLSSFYNFNKLFDIASYYKNKQANLIKENKPIDSIALMWTQYDLQVIDFSSDNNLLDVKRMEFILDFALRHKLNHLKNVALAVYRSQLIEAGKIEMLNDLYTKRFPSELQLLAQVNPSLYFRLKAYFCEEKYMPDSSVYYFQKAEKILEPDPNKILKSNFYIRFGQFYARHGKDNEAIKTFNKAYELAEEASYFDYMLSASKQLESIYSGLKDYKNAYRYSILNKGLMDSLFNEEKSKKITQLQMQFEFDKKQQTDSVQHAHENNLNLLKLQRQRAKTYAGFIGFGLVALLLFFVYRNYQNQKKANKIIRDTQQQLIQQEKLASLGQLTAGIAHEIRNPLNFVNNFSQLSNELIHEMRQTKDEQERNGLLNDLEQNLEKINHHGNRAGDIVTSMLEHSQAGTSVKQLTDINKLSEDFFKLAYNGMRAHNSDFSCEIKQALAPDIPAVNIVSQDVGRTLLNLFKNAFYAVNEKRKINTNYNPMVELTTGYHGKSLTITVRDNGTGIHNSIKDKIFQPFFTTKPTGQGTGLGLSLSYDIIKAHGGDIKMKSDPADGTTFSIEIPC